MKSDVIIYRYGIMDAQSVNFRKKIQAYLKKNNLDLDKTEEYLEKYSEDQFDELIREFYEIKGKFVTVEAIQKAIRKNSGRCLTEYEEQCKVVKYLRDNKIKCQSSGNGFALDTKDNVKYVAKLKASGMSVGYNDLDVFIGKGETLHIEMKRGKGGVVSEAQQKWINWFNDNGYKAKVCYGADEAINWIKENIDLLNNN